MSSYHGPKAKVQRRFGELLAPRPKYQRILDRRNYPPGQHGPEKQFRGSRRRSDFGIQLDEKQKLAFIYNVREGQLRRYYLKAAKGKSATGAEMIKLLERRLDNIVYRSGLAPTIWAARQLVVHRHIEIDGSIVDRPAYTVKPGEVISIKAEMQKNPQFKQWRDEAVAAPQYIKVNRDKFTAELDYIPERVEIPLPVNEQLVVEFYNRRT